MNAAVSAADPQAWLSAGALALGLLALALQWLGMRSRGRGRISGRAAFLAGAGAWVLFGLLQRGPAESRGGAFVLGWLLPALGLCAAALLRWIRIDFPALLAEEEVTLPEAIAEAGEPTEALDAEDARLLQRLSSLRRRRVVEFVVPLARMPHVRVADSGEDVRARLARTASARLPLLEERGARLVGLLDGRDWLEIAPAGGEGEPGVRASAWRARVREMPVFEGHRRTGELIEVLGREGDRIGLAAVQSPAGDLLGFVGWEQIFRVLVGRSPFGVER